MAANLQLHYYERLRTPEFDLRIHLILRLSLFYASCPLTTPGTYFTVCESVKNPAGFASICLTVNPAPVSVPLTSTPVTNGPVKHPTDRRATAGSSLMGNGFGMAMRGGPDAPATA